MKGAVMTSSTYAGARGIGSLTIPRTYKNMQVLLVDGSYSESTVTLFVDDDGVGTEGVLSVGQAIVVARDERLHVLRVFGRRAFLGHHSDMQCSATLGDLVDLTKPFVRMRFRKALRRAVRELK